MTVHEEFATWDAAYVLGALTPADRHAFESHLETCERCRAAVAELAPIPGLLTRAQPWLEAPEGAEPVGPPPNLVSLVEARQRKSARRRVAWIAAGAAAVLALGIAVPVSILGDGPAGAEAVAMQPVADTQMTASVALQPAAWGTSISMTCDYPEGGTWSGPGGAWTYVLTVTDTAGETSQVATWAAVPGETISVDASTAVAVDDIASLEIRSSSGEVVLQTTA